jgi:hypothetical protein
MKKNKMMRIASVLLVAVLLSTCAISGTFAKYVTAEDGSDSARVAKWGVVVEAESFKLFTNEYKTDDTGFTGTYSVQSGATPADNVFAPGTKGTFANFAITGTPEVAVEVDVLSSVKLSGNWEVGGKFYCPIVITVGTTAISGLDYTSALSFESAIEVATLSYCGAYEPNEDLSDIKVKDFDISWEWAFEGAGGHVTALDCDCADDVQCDYKDSVLGTRAATEDLKIEIRVAITVTQIN